MWLINDIGAGAIPVASDANYYCNVWMTSDDTTNHPDNNTQFYGDVFYNACQGIQVTSTAGTSSTTAATFKDVYIDSPANSNCTTYSSSDYPSTSYGLNWGAPFGANIEEMTITNTPSGGAGIHTGASTGTHTVYDTLLEGNATAMAGSTDPGHAYVDFYNNTANGVTLSGTDITSDPGLSTSTYGRGGYLFIPNTSPDYQIGDGDSDSDSDDAGAGILCELNSIGEHTSTPLWPWPNNSLIYAVSGNTLDVTANIWTTTSGLPSC